MNWKRTNIQKNEEKFLQNIILDTWPTTYSVEYEAGTPWPLVVFDRLGFELGRFRSSRYTADRLNAALERLRKRKR
jgi:hypothetical protein